MIKGVSKQVLEVTNTENPYFEKIVFFVKPEYRDEDRKLIERQAQAVAKSAGKPPKIRRTKREIRSILFRCVICAFAGVALTFLINTFI